LLTSAFLCIWSYGAQSAASDKPSLSLQHPKIRAVRSLYRSIEGGISAGRLTKHKRTVESCNNGLPENRTFYFDAQKRVRKYVTEGGHDDYTLTFRYYYDVAGKLRFVFVTGGAINGSIMEERIYFDRRGALLRDERKWTTGPGYPFVDFVKDNLLQRNPRRAFEQKCSPRCCSSLSK
jgi:hypothetical protein